MSGKIVILCLAFIVQQCLCVTISDIILRIPQEQIFLKQQTDSSKTTIKQNIDSTRNSLNSRAIAMKADVTKGPAKCFVWNDQISSIQQHQINFMYQFQSCEMSTAFSKLKKTETSLASLLKTALQLQATCTLLPGMNCQAQINSFYNTLDLIHNNIVIDVQGILRDSDNCLQGKAKSIDKSLDSVENYWKKCVESNQL